MNPHPLTSLMAPRSLVVLTSPEGQRSAAAELLLTHLKSQRFEGEFTRFFDLAEDSHLPERFE